MQSARQSFSVSENFRQSLMIPDNMSHLEVLPTMLHESVQAAG